MLTHQQKIDKAFLFQFILASSRARTTRLVKRSSEVKLRERSGGGITAGQVTSAGGGMRGELVRSWALEGRIPEWASSWQPRSDQVSPIRRPADLTK